MAKILDDELCPCRSGKAFGECHGPRMLSRRPRHIAKGERLMVIPEPDPGTRAVFKKTTEGTVIFIGLDSDLALQCGTCGSALVEGLNRDQIRNLVLQCNRCSAFNEVS